MIVPVQFFRSNFRQRPFGVPHIEIMECFFFVFFVIPSCSLWLGKTLSVGEGAITIQPLPVLQKNGGQFFQFVFFCFRQTQSLFIPGFQKKHPFVVRIPL